MTADIRLALTEVSVRAQQQFDPGKHEAEERRDAMPLAISGTRILMKNRGTNSRPESGFVDLARHPGHESFQDPHRQCTLKMQCATRPPTRIEQIDRRINIETAVRRPAAGAIRFDSSQKNRCLSPRSDNAKTVSRPAQGDRNRITVLISTFSAIDVTGIQLSSVKIAHVVGKGRLMRPQRHGRDDL